MPTIDPVKKDLRTTIAGFVVGAGIILTQLGHLLDADPATVISWPVLIAGLGAIGLGWFASDK